LTIKSIDAKKDTTEMPRKAAPRGLTPENASPKAIVVELISAHTIFIFSSFYI